MLLRARDRFQFRRLEQPGLVRTLDLLLVLRRVLVHLFAEVGVVLQVGPPDLVEEPPEPLRATAEDVHVAIDRRSGAQRGARARRLTAAREPAVGRGSQGDRAAVAEARLRLVDGLVDPVAGAATLDAEPREQDRERGREARVVVRRVAAEFGRLAVGRTVAVQRPAHRLQGDLGADVVAPRPALSERCDRGHYEVRARR